MHAASSTIAPRSVPVKLRRPATHQEREALDSLISRAHPAIQAACAAIRAHRNLPPVTATARIFNGPSGAEPVVVVTFNLSEAVDLGLVAAEQRMARDLRERFIAAGLFVGGVIAPTSQVWIRGSAIASTGSAIAAQVAA